MKYLESTLGRSSDLPSFNCSRRPSRRDVTRIYASVSCPALLAFVLCPTPGLTHEYWLDPLDTTVPVGARVLIDTRNGQDFVGSAFPYNPERFQSATLASPSQQTPLSSELGDYPAFHLNIMEVGTHRVAVSTTQNLLSYSTRADFDEFLVYHGFSDTETKRLLGDQASALLPQHNIQEGYYRYATTYITGHDNATETSKNTGPDTGPDTEQDNEPDGPLLNTLTDHAFSLHPLNDPTLCRSPLAVELSYEGMPVNNRQVELFHEVSDEADTVTRYTARTNENSVAIFDINEPGHYLINAVLLAPPDRPGLNLTSHWASMTFTCD